MTSLSTYLVALADDMAHRQDININMHELVLGIKTFRFPIAHSNIASSISENHIHIIVLLESVSEKAAADND